MRFDVQGMTCGHCVRAITRAVQALDPTAQVTVDLKAGKVDVLAEGPTAERIIAAIAAEGYTATIDA